ncbi:MAG: hypothetical protein ABIS67_09020, partial [Candidatus Eisenbacteria bacterium]
VWFVGDFLLREGAMRQSGDFRSMFPQAQPLDVFLHHRVPQALLARGLDTTLNARLLGAFEAGILALLAARFARGFGLRGAAAFAVGSAVFAGGYLALFAGYAKPTIEVCVLSVAVGVFGVEMLRGRRGALGMSIAFIAAVGFHRSALSLLPGVALFWLLALRRHGVPRERRIEFAVAAIVLAAGLGWFLPRLWQLFGAFDLATNFVSYEVRQQGGPLAAAFSGMRLLDLANLLVLHVPLVVSVPALVVGRGSGSSGFAERPVAVSRNGAPPIAPALAGLFAGHLPAVLFTYVTQGSFRDWDAHAGAFATLALWVAALLASCFAESVVRHPQAGALHLQAEGGPAVNRVPRADGGLASACAVTAFAATLTLLVAQNDLGRGLGRARAFVTEPPARTESHQLATLDFLGLRYLRLERFGESADAFASLAQRAPHPRALVLHGTAALLARRNAEARDAFATLTHRDTTHSVAWLGLWLAAGRSGDSALAAAAGRRVLSYPDTSTEMERILRHLQHYPGLWTLMPRGRFSAE